MKVKVSRAKLLEAYATMAKTNVNTGVKNYMGRTIYQGPRGGKFVRVSGRKVYRIRK
jgi:hypothetical protein